MCPITPRSRGARRSWVRSPSTKTSRRRRCTSDRQQRSRCPRGQLRRAPNSRDYRKLHLCVDEQSGEVVAGELTSKRARDSSRVASACRTERTVPSHRPELTPHTTPAASIRQSRITAPSLAEGADRRARAPCSHRGRRAADSAIATLQHKLGSANESGTQNRATANGAKSRQRSIATRLSWAQRCEREGWRHRELRQGSGARFSTP